MSKKYLKELLGLKIQVKDIDLFENDVFYKLVDRLMAMETALIQVIEIQEETKANIKKLEGGIELIAETLLTTDVVGGQEKNMKTLGGMIDGMNTIHDNMQTVIKVLNEKGIITEEDL